MNSVNPFRLEGQKSIIFRILEARDWQPPDWVIVPGGNLGNTAAFGKAFQELKDLGLIKKIPRLAVINAHGANTLYKLAHEQKLTWNDGRYDRAAVQKHYAWMDEQHVQASTIASAIEIGRPVNLPKALRSLKVMDGVVREVTDEEILEARALVARYGFGCEPASAASVAGLQKLLAEQIISKGDIVVCILTGHELKDPNATVKYHTGLDMKSVQDMAPQTDPHGKLSNRPVPVEDSLEAIVKAMGGETGMIKGLRVEASKSPVPVGEY
jgi:threonine synthase